MSKPLPLYSQMRPGFINRLDEPGELPDSSQAELDAALTVLSAYKNDWVRLRLEQKIEILEQTLKDVCEVSETWWAVSVAAKETRGNLVGEAEEWVMVATVMRLISLIIDSLHDIREHGRPQIPGPVRTLGNGQIAAQVFPIRRYDRLFLQGTTAEVWMQPGVSQEEMLEGQARLLLDPPRFGTLCLILAAGSHSAAVPMDFLYKLFIEGRVVIVKMNPVNDYLGPVLSRAFRELIVRGYLRFVYGGVEEGGYLCHHPLVDEVHITGSDKTYEAVVFGGGESGAQRKARGRPLLLKPVTGSLGTIAPLIIVPGLWSEEDITRQTERLALWLTSNAGFNCLTPRLLVQWAGWEQCHAFNEALAATLDQIPTRKAYYPGAFERQAAFLANHPQAQLLGSAEEGHLPWTFITGIAAEDADDISFRNEPFCGLLTATAVTAPDPFSFLESAVRFANETLWGNLTATLIVHPTCLKKRHIARAVENAVADLRMGMVLVNQFAGSGYMIGSTTWGAFPGNSIEDIQSGIGIVGNTLMFDRPQKSVVRGPFLPPLEPLSVNSRTVYETCRKLKDVQLDPSLANVSGMLWHAIRG